MRAANSGLVGGWDYLLCHFLPYNNPHNGVPHGKTHAGMRRPNSQGTDIAQSWVGGTPHEMGPAIAPTSRAQQDYSFTHLSVVCLSAGADE